MMVLVSSLARTLITTSMVIPDPTPSRAYTARIDFTTTERRRRY